jgi:hypothetical protein
MQIAFVQKDWFEKVIPNTDGTLVSKSTPGAAAVPWPPKAKKAVLNPPALDWGWKPFTDNSHQEQGDTQQHAVHDVRIVDVERAYKLVEAGLETVTREFVIEVENKGGLGGTYQHSWGYTWTNETARMKDPQKVPAEFYARSDKGTGKFSAGFGLDGLESLNS